MIGVPPQNQNVNPEILRNIQELPIELRNLINEEIWESLTYEQKDLLLNLEHLPTSLNGVLPENVWGTLSVKQKLEVLISYEMLPKLSFEGFMNTLPAEQEVQPEQYIEQETFPQQQEVGNDNVETRVSIDIEDPAKKEFEEIKQRIQTIESDAEREPAPNQNVEQQTTEVAQAPEQQIVEPTFTKPTISKFTGFQPSDSLMNNYEEKVNGDIKKGETWIANIVQKLVLALSRQDE